MKLTKAYLQQIIREEYVKVLFESNGQTISDEKARLIAENLEEGLFGDLVKTFKAGKEAFGSARKESLASSAAAAMDSIASKLDKSMKDLFSSTARELQSKANLSMEDAAEKAQSLMTISASKLVPSLEPVAQKMERDIELDFTDPDTYAWLQTGERPSGEYPAAKKQKKMIGRPVPRVRTGSGQMRGASGF
jgi:hypothetical protein